MAVNPFALPPEPERPRGRESDETQADLEALRQRLDTLEARADQLETQLANLRDFSS